MNGWQGLFSELPIVGLNLIIWSCEILISLTEVKSWDEEDENSYNKGNKKSECFFTDEDSEVLVFCPEEGSTKS